MGGWNRSRGDGLAAAASRAVEAWLIGSYMDQSMLELEAALRREREKGAERVRRHRAKPEEANDVRAQEGDGLR